MSVGNELATELGNDRDAMLKPSRIDRHEPSSAQERRHAMTDWRCSPSFSIPSLMLSPAAR